VQSLLSSPLLAKHRHRIDCPATLRLEPRQRGWVGGRTGWRSTSSSGCGRPRTDDRDGGIVDDHSGSGTDRRSLNELILAVARERDRVAFGALFGHFAPRLKAFLMRQGAEAGSAEELVQEVMLLVWRRADTFDPRQANASTWIFTIARNKRIDLLRREKRPELDADDPALVPAPAEPADRLFESWQDGERLRTALKTLPPEQAELLHMAYFEDKAHSTIAAERGIPLGTVKSRLRLAMERLRKQLKG